jgi:hypothetical protein
MTMNDAKAIIDMRLKLRPGIPSTPLSQIAALAGH